MLGAHFNEAQINKQNPLGHMAIMPYNWIYFQIKLLAYAFHSFYYTYPVFFIYFFSWKVVCRVICPDIYKYK